MTEMQSALRTAGLYDKHGTKNAFLAYGGEARCLLRMIRANDNVVDAAIVQLTAILEYRRKYEIDDLDPTLALEHPCKPFWVAELAGLGDVGHVRGAVVQVTVPRFVQPAKIVELFKQEELDYFFVLWMELRLQRQRESIAADKHSDHMDDRVLEVYDLSGLSFRQIHVKGLKMLSSSLGLCQANYPEDLCQTYIMNAPGYFSIAWKIIS